MAAIRTNRTISSVLFAVALIGRSAVGECQSTAAGSSAQPAPASLPAVPVVRVVHGFNSTIYEVTGPLLTRTATDPYPSNICGAQYGGPPTPSPVGTATPVPFVTAAPLTSGIWLTNAPTTNNPQCPVADIVATQQALGIEVVSSPAPTSTPTPSTRVDNVDFTTDPYVKVLVCKISCPVPGSNNRANVVLEYHVNASNNVYTLQHDRLAPQAIAKAGALSMVAPSAAPASQTGGTVPAPSTTPTPPPPPAPWSASIAIPWSALELPPDGTTVIVVQVSNGDAPPIGARAISIESRPAFRGTTPTVAKADNDNRWGTLTLYDQYVSPTTTPPPTVPGPGNSVLTLLKPPDPQGAANRFPVTGDVSAPITNAVAFSGTLAQNASVIQGVQTAINAQVGTAVLPTPSPLPSVPCATCGTFQSANAPSFSLPKGSAHLLLPNKSLGSDDSPFALAALGDLRAAGTLQYVNGASALGVLQTQIVDATTRLSSSDSAIGYQSQRGQATFSGLALFANHQQPPATPLAPGAPAIPPGNVTIPHLATYAFALVNDHVSSTKGCGATISGDLRDRRDCGTGLAAPAAVLSDVTQFARAAYDVTDGAFNGFGGFQDKRTVIGGAGEQFSRTLMLGYRATGRNYQEIDGTQIALPTVSGPVASIEISTQRPNRTMPTFDLVASAHRYYSQRDQARWQDAKLTFNFSDYVGAFYEIQGTRVTAALAAVNKLGGQLGDAPYQGAVNQLLSPLSSSLSSRDQTVGFNLSGTTKQDSKLTFTFGYGFDHAEPDCTSSPVAASVVPFTTRTAIVCRPGVATKSYTLGGSIVANTVTLAASFVPTYFREARSSSPPAERVYNVVFGYKLNPCDGILVTATNDAGVLSLSSIGRLQSAFQAELDVQRGFGLYRTNALLPTLFLGVQNKFGFSPTAYTGVIAPATVQSVFPAAITTHQVTVYTGLRFGNRAFRASTAPDPTCAPPPKDAAS